MPDQPDTNDDRSREILNEAEARMEQAKKRMEVAQDRAGALPPPGSRAADIQAQAEERKAKAERQKGGQEILEDLTLIAPHDVPVNQLPPGMWAGGILNEEEWGKGVDADWGEGGEELPAAEGEIAFSLRDIALMDVTHNGGLVYYDGATYTVAKATVAIDAGSTQASPDWVVMEFDTVALTGTITTTGNSATPPAFWDVGPPGTYSVVLGTYWQDAFNGGNHAVPRYLDETSYHRQGDIFLPTPAAVANYPFKLHYQAGDTAYLQVGMVEVPAPAPCTTYPDYPTVMGTLITAVPVLNLTALNGVDFRGQYCNAVLEVTTAASTGAAAPADICDCLCLTGVDLKFYLDGAIPGDVAPVCGVSPGPPYAVNGVQYLHIARWAIPADPPDSGNPDEDDPGFTHVKNNLHLSCCDGTFLMTPTGG